MVERERKRKLEREGVGGGVGWVLNVVFKNSY
jgi:hypothetical protein